MITADVLNKLGCKFIEEVNTYIVNSKYIINPCLDEVYTSFSNYKLASSLVDCITYEDECSINKAASHLVGPDDCAPVIKSCANQSTVSITKSTTSCNYSIHPYDSDGNVASKAEVILANDTWEQQASIGFKCTSNACPESDVTTVTSNGANLEVGFKFAEGNDGFVANSSGYVKTIRLYKAIDGVLDTFIDADVSPSNITAWDWGVGAHSINALDLYFGSSNWATAFRDLIENVCNTWVAPGANQYMWNTSKNPWASSPYLQIVAAVRHNSVGTYIGISPQDYYLEWVNDAGDIIDSNTIPVSNVTIVYSFVLDSNFSVSTQCGNYTGHVSTTGKPTVNTAQTSFYKIVYSNRFLNNFLSWNYSFPPPCGTTTLKATYSTSSPILTKYWEHPSGTEISEEDSIIANEAGQYDFIVNLENGCSKTTSITI